MIFELERNFEFFGFDLPQPRSTSKKFRTVRKFAELLGVLENQPPILQSLQSFQSSSTSSPGIQGFYILWGGSASKSTTVASRPRMLMALLSSLGRTLGPLGPSFFPHFSDFFEISWIFYKNSHSEPIFGITNFHEF